MKSDEEKNLSLDVGSCVRVGVKASTSNERDELFIKGRRILTVNIDDCNLEDRDFLIKRLSFETDKIRLWEASVFDASNRPVMILETQFEAEEKSTLEGNFTLPLIGQCLVGKKQYKFFDARGAISFEHWRKSNQNASPDKILKIISDLCLALEQIHSQDHWVTYFFPQTTFIYDDKLAFIFLQPNLGARYPRICLNIPQALRSYVAPELFVTSCKFHNQAVDIFTTSAILYFLISGKAPPAGEVSFFETVFGPRHYQPNFPLGWEDVILNNLSPIPSKRTFSISQFLHLLFLRFRIMQLRCNFEGMLRFNHAVDTHIGIQKKLRYPINQDAVLLLEKQEKQSLLMTVADGVSTATYGSGELASQIVIREAKNAWDNIDWSKELNKTSFLERIIYAANNEICEYINRHYANKSPQIAEVMGSTALIAFVEGNLLSIASIGDSRCYIIRDESISCLTRDHNLFTMSVIAGAPLERSLVHPNAAALTQCLGFFELSYDPENPLKALNPPFDLFSLRLIPGDRVLLTTDGLIDCIGDNIDDVENTIANIIRSQDCPSLACLELILAANRGGGFDNIGVGLIYVESATKKSNTPTLDLEYDLHD